MKLEGLSLYRRRYIPDEFIRLKDDKMVHLDDDILVTHWKTLRPRQDFARGESIFFLKKGWKVSKIFDAEDNVSHWYCDIVDYVMNEEENSIIYEDLLFDVVVYPSGKVKVLDCDEAADAFENTQITREQLLQALRSLHELLDLIYHSRFDRIQALINEYADK